MRRKSARSLMVRALSSRSSGRATPAGLILRGGLVAAVVVVVGDVRWEVAAPLMLLPEVGGAVEGV